MEKKLRWFITRGGVWTAVAVMLLLAGTIALTAPWGVEAPAEGQAAAVDAAARVAEGCELVQTLTYTRCEHSVVRRVAAPAELLGKTLAEVEPLYDLWRITGFGAKQIDMSQQPDLFCPDHVVLMSDDAGRLCVFQNKYGDALALVNELGAEIGALPAAMQEEVRRGVGFATLQELEHWLESAES